MTEHPPAEAIAAYLSDGLPAPDRATIEAHFAECRACRQEVTSARQLLQPGLFRSRWSMVVPAAAAAVLALALLGRGVLRPPVEQEAVRGSEAANEVEAAPSIQVLRPMNEATVAGRAVAFAWAGQPGRPLYRLILTDGSGRALWSKDTNDTTVTLPAGITLTPGRTYFWYVDGLDSAGRTLTTGTRTFSIQP
jgi:putative zinc finger protein